MVNLAVLFHHLRRGDWQITDGTALSALSALALVNITAAVLIRQQTFLNILYGLAGRGSRSWPLWVRWSVSKVHHVGGLHAGFGFAGTAWLFAFTGVAFVTRARHPGNVTDTTSRCARPHRSAPERTTCSSSRTAGVAGRRSCSSGR